jgi:sulfatase maturation enzyme AslB (radical SAM superfamily)
MSKNIDLFVSTNATHKLTDTWRKILTNFNNVIINTSIDGISDRFTYMRHPGKWSDAEENIKSFFELQQTNSNINVVPVITVSALNVYYVPEVFDYFKQYNVEPFIIMVQWPQYYCVNVIPDSVKPYIVKRFVEYNNPKFEPILNLMNTEPKTYQPNSKRSPWEEFKFWTRAKDEYRNEDFLMTFKEIGSIIVDHKEW